MNCVGCRQEEATLHIARTIDGVRSIVRLCAKCAEEVGLVGTLERLEVLVRRAAPVVDGGFGDLKLEELPLAVALQCPKCGMTAEEARQNGRFGCEECYSLFGGRLDGGISASGETEAFERCAAPCFGSGKQRNGPSSGQEPRQGTPEDLADRFYAPAVSLEDDPDDFFLETRLEVSRNLTDRKFPGRMEPEERAEFRRAVTRRLSEELAEEIVEFPVRFQTGPRRVLLASQALPRRRRGFYPHGTVLSIARGVSVELNGEDHLTVTVQTPGFGLDELRWKAGEVLGAAGGEGRWAVHSRFGFLTARPENAGPAAYVETLIHTPFHLYFGLGCSLGDLAEKVRLGLQPLGCNSLEQHAFFRLYAFPHWDRGLEGRIKDMTELADRIRGEERILKERLKPDDVSQIRKMAKRSLQMAENAWRMGRHDVLRCLSFLSMAWAVGRTPWEKRSLLGLVKEFSTPYLQFQKGRMLTVNECERVRAARFAELVRELSSRTRQEILK